MTNSFIICCKKLPPIVEMSMFSIWEGVAFYVIGLLRTSASRPLRLNLLVLEVFEVCITLYRRRLSPEAEHDTCEVAESLGAEESCVTCTYLLEVSSVCRVPEHVLAAVSCETEPYLAAVHGHFLYMVHRAECIVSTYNPFAALLGNLYVIVSVIVHVYCHTRLVAVACVSELDACLCLEIKVLLTESDE